MTLIFGFDAVTQVLLIGDSRVTFEGAQIVTQDSLIKLYPISPNPPLAIGFSGSISGAKKVLDFVLKDKLATLTRRAVIPEFAEDIRKWIEYIAKKDLNDQEVILSFILAGVETTRRAPLYRNGVLAGDSPFPESFLYTYRISRRTRNVTCKRQALSAMIGSGADMKDRVIKTGKDLVGFGIGQPSARDLRGSVITSSLASMFHKSSVHTVGGPFQTLELQETGIGIGFQLPVDEMGEDFSQGVKGNTVTIKVPSKNIEYSLHSIFEFDPSSLPAGAEA